MPREDHAAAVLTAMADGKAWSVARLETVADVRRTRLELLLKVLEVDGAVERVQGGWRSTGQPWIYDADRYARVTRTREAEQRAMIAYARPVDEAECRMSFLQHALDDRPRHRAAGATSASAPGTPPSCPRPPPKRRRPFLTGRESSSLLGPSGQRAPTGSVST